MSISTDTLPKQLKLVCKAAGATWLAVAQQGPQGRVIGAAHGLIVSRRRALEAWLQGEPAFSPRQPASRAGLGAGTVYAFAAPHAGSWLLVGAKSLTPAGRAALEAVALGLPRPSAESAGQAFYSAANNPERLFEEALAELLKSVPAKSGLLARWHGEEFRIEAGWQIPQKTRGTVLLADGGTDLSELREPLEVLSLTREQARQRLGLPLTKAAKYAHWLVLPLEQGERVVGLAAVSRAIPFGEEEKQAALKATEQVAAGLVRAGAALEARQALKRQQLLEEAAGLAAQELDLDELAKRLQRLMLRRFGAANAEVLLLCRDQKCLEGVTSPKRGAPRTRYSLESTLVGAVARIGQTVRIGSFARQSQFASPRKGVASKLATPLALNDEAIGVLAVESRQPDAFSAADEQALEMLARLAVGLVENARLRAALAARSAALVHLNELARKLETAVDGASVAAVVAGWLASVLSADLALLLMLDTGRGELVAEGVAGARATELPPGLRIARGLGAPGEALQYGRSFLIHDVAESGDHFPVTGRVAGCVLAVPVGSEGHWQGVLLAERSEPYGFDAPVLDLVETAARLAQAALARLSGEPPARLAELLEANQHLQGELEERRQAQVSAEERLVRSAKLAAVGEMAAGVAHELNNPLTTVSGFTELILDQMDAESPLRPDLELVLAEARRARGVVRRLLDFSRPSEFLRTPADLNDELTQAMSLVHHVARTSGVEMRVSLWGDLPPVRIDRSQMQQVFLNLIHNAVQAMPQGGSLVLRTEVRQQEGRAFVTASVQDSGEGIRPEDLDKVFEPFFTTKPAGQGTGLGLSVSYGIVADHGGFIEATSEEGNGATFTVWLPVSEPGDGDG